MHADKRLTSKPHPEAGFTLIEVLIAIMIITIAYTALIKLNIMNMRLIESSESYLDAVRVSRAVLQKTTFEVGTLDTGTQSGSRDLNQTSYDWEREISTIGIPGVFKVLVTVNWQPQNNPLASKNNSQTVSFYEYYTKQ